MTTGFRVMLALVASALLGTGLAGCGNGHSGGHAQDHDHARGHADGAGNEEHRGHGHDDEGHGASFDEVTGLALEPAALEQIGLKTAEVTRERLASSFKATAQVFGRGSMEEVAHASAIIPVSNAALFKVGERVAVTRSGSVSDRYAGRLAVLDEQTTKAIGQVEALIDVTDPGATLEIGSFVDVVFRSDEREVTAMPKHALLDAALGKFVYVKTDGRFVRRPVKVGAEGERHVEVIEGLSPGDVVVTDGVLDLWLIELRLTKGGGHAH